MREFASSDIDPHYSKAPSSLKFLGLGPVDSLPQRAQSSCDQSFASHLGLVDTRRENIGFRGLASETMSIMTHWMDFAGYPDRRHSRKIDER